MAINHDRLFKQLLTTFFVEFLELFFPEVLSYLEQDSINKYNRTKTTGENYGINNILEKGRI
jgi:hypothetical protein